MSAVFADPAPGPDVELLDPALDDAESLLARLSFDDEGFPTETSDAQFEVEDSVRPLLLNKPADPKLLRARHVAYLQQSLPGLSRWFVSLDASKPWIVMWILHALDLLGVPLSDRIKTSAISTIAACECATGGYGGGPGQIAHLATTYAAINALAIVGTEEAYRSINRPTLYMFLLSQKQPDGSFRMHDGGEIDVRGTYCALNTAQLLGMMTSDLTDRAAEFVSRCQTYEGGIGPVPGVEAHGGYSFCALAAMHILGKIDMLDLDALTSWVCARQMQLEGGYQGRTNKLVDGCYSFWQGGIAALLELHLSRKHGYPVHLMDRNALQTYILVCCQSERGGLRDKPAKGPDFYHSCYVLSGLSLTQYDYSTSDGETVVATLSPTNLGPASNILRSTHPAHNLAFEHIQSIQAFFASQP
ncbi:terpenoid cyclases/protein prenyltransferase alpha-alpha toroid [Entophlyctis helioformis]|nr:terpenoid cyclases/protein prenyltransferase alpha-alpha toroid [Entophlyctis helioformis]